jgi:plasmid stabilization system protein ParE
MGYQVIWSDAAVEDLRGICSHIAEDNPAAARRVGEGILQHVGLLGDFPLIGPTYPRGSRGPLREIVFRPYRIFYDVYEDSKTVTILHLWHGARQDPEF